MCVSSVVLFLTGVINVKLFIDKREDFVSFCVYKYTRIKGKFKNTRLISNQKRQKTICKKLKKLFSETKLCFIESQNIESLIKNYGELKLYMENMDNKNYIKCFKIMLLMKEYIGLREREEYLKGDVVNFENQSAKLDTIIYWG